MAGREQFDVFLSYSSRDKLIAEALAERLRRDGFRCWKAPESIPAATPYPEAIVADIPRCRVMLVLLSDKANYSHHVQRELLCARNEKRQGRGMSSRDGPSNSGSPRRQRIPARRSASVMSVPATSADVRPGSQCRIATKHPAPIADAVA